MPAYLPSVRKKATIPKGTGSAKALRQARGPLHNIHAEKCQVISMIALIQHLPQK